MQRCLPQVSRTPLSSCTFSRYVNAHATSTPVGDGIEARAIAQLLPGVSASSFKGPPLPRSISGHFGHCLGAAGAVETAATVLALQQKRKPRNLGLEVSDCDEGLRLLREDEDWSEERRVALVNSFGFGGTNASLVVSSYSP